MLSDQWISFEAGLETYVHSVGKAKEIIPYIAPVPVPEPPCFAESILNVRENVVTALSSRSLLGLDQDGSSEEGRIMILEVSGKLFGLSVDSIGDIITFQSDQAEWGGQVGQYPLIKGTFHQCGQLYILADFSICFDSCSEIS